MPRGIDQIVNERVLRWQTEQRRSPSAPPPSAVRSKLQKPMLTISRECGSLGGRIGRMVAERLGCEFYSQELVHHIASFAHVPEHAVASLDEHARGRLEVMLREIFDGHAFAAHDYRWSLTKVLREIALRGTGVVIGRGGHLLLDPRMTLRVRTYASLEQRIRNLSERHDLTRAQARAVLRRIDDDRTAFYRQQFAVDVADPLRFDLLVNTTATPAAECAAMITEAFYARFGRSSVAQAV